MNNCPKCNAKLNIVISGRDYIISCSKCNYKVITTNNEDIDLDSTKYSISILPNNDITIDKIKLISKLTSKKLFKFKNIFNTRKTNFYRLCY